MTNEDYRNGYKDGFEDGFEKAKKQFYSNKPNPFSPTPIPNAPISVNEYCKICGMKFTDSLGRLMPMGYVCSNPQCPSNVSCYTTNSTTGKQLLNE